ncbi:hypothetical protein HZC30_00085 [Candidatus Woesearchaeota archaeon]|nr:hypothetical protein [Candidatus Woesearchaeota archaeon]
MDVERIQKINAMALELMKQGLAADREDAVIQAERIFRSQGANEYSSLRDTMGKVEAEAAMDSKPGAEKPALPQDEVRQIMEENTRFMVRKLKEIEDKLQALERDIAAINSRMTYQRPSAPAQAPLAPGELPPNPQIQRGAGQQVGSSHPRSGNYNDADVSIEKFFYMGRK